MSKIFSPHVVAGAKRPLDENFIVYIIGLKKTILEKHLSTSDISRDIFIDGLRSILLDIDRKALSAEQVNHTCANYLEQHLSKHAISNIRRLYNTYYSRKNREVVNCQIPKEIYSEIALIKDQLGYKDINEVLHMLISCYQRGCDDEDM